MNNEKTLDKLRQMCVSWTTSACNPLTHKQELPCWIS